MKTKPIVRAIIVVEEANFVPNQEESKMILIQPILNFNVPFIPTQLSFNIVVSLSHFSRGEKYNVEVRLKDTTGNYLNSMSWEISDHDEENDIPAGGIIVAGIKNLPIYNEGNYDIEVFADNEKVGEEFFTVYKNRG
ncbi:hypothetical protein QPK24_22080 [Paenibacillus polygoni]|uniref:Ig-like domain-containing protein n=1 Tax=Paenibacillus polygoni TaxID=3050112 RepID=A0ABY8X0J0_9BACL|nr:hypothetical protein [Paenibacillus polygoni]WIV18975.1 hypothetical protein QPK24_22080 [Paenibacillus polygoni]